MLWPLVRLGLRLLIGSWRLRVIGHAEELEPSQPVGPVIFAFWHSGLVPCGAALYRRRVSRGSSVTALVSRSGDGELVARAAQDFGFDTVRGSTSRGGFVALRSLRQALVRERRSVVIVPDGPRGPAGVAKPGIIQLAAVTGVPIVPLAAASSGAWRASSWDRTEMPRPFTRITVAVGAPERFERSAAPEEGAALLMKRLTELEVMAEAASSDRSRRAQSK